MVFLVYRLHTERMCKFMNKTSKLNLSDRVSIEIGIARNENFKEIAAKVGCSQSAVSREIKKNRTSMRGTYPCGNDCKFVKACFRSHQCGDKACYIDFLNNVLRSSRKYICQPKTCIKSPINLSSSASIYSYRR